MLDRISEKIYLLSAHEEDHVRYAPLGYHRFDLRAPEKPEALAEDASLGERLRWFRKNQGLRQADVAQTAGLSRSAYINLETGTVDHCSREVADRLAAFYGIAVEALLDDYNLFLYRGQGNGILKLRQQVRMGKKPFARSLGVSDSSLRDWEAERKRVSKKSWDKYFKEFANDC